MGAVWRMDEKGEDLKRSCLRIKTSPEMRGTGLRGFGGTSAVRTREEDMNPGPSL